MTEPPSDLLDRYLRGETSPEEERTLARQALEDQDLFDLLATVGLTKAALRDERASQAATSANQPWRPAYAVWGGLAAAAALAAFVAGWAIAPRVTAPPPSSEARSLSPEAPATSVPVADVQHPTFLAAALEMPNVLGRRQEFRTVGSARRLPQSRGTILSVESGAALVDLGAVDGLAKGSVVVLEADPGLNLPEVHAKVTTVFRDQARVDLAEEARVGRHVRVAVTANLLALSAVIADGSAAGDAELVRAAASRASTVARSGEAKADARRLVLLQLAALARSRNDAAATQRYLREALQLADAAPPASAAQRSEMLNAIATVAAAAGNLADAEATLRQAQQHAPAGSPAAAQVMNNLGAIAALRGDPVHARTFYQSALALMPSSAQAPGRVVVEHNLSLAGPSR
ncbi:MAG: tetratricopeptide repeat protein [Acidobacteriota bacterium]